MDNLPAELLLDILGRITRTADRNSVSLTCKRFHKLDNVLRISMRVGCGLHPVCDALTALCSRFSNLEKVEIFYSGWMSKLGKQLDDNSLLILSSRCPLLKDLTLSCKTLSVLHLIRCLNVGSMEWLEYLGKHEMLEDLCIKNCRAIGEGDLIKLGPTWRKLKTLQFEVDANYRYMKLYDRLSVDWWQNQWVPYENMLKLSLVNCVISPGRGLACVIGNCKNLEKIHLDMCVGVRDRDSVFGPKIKQPSIKLSPGPIRLLPSSVTKQSVAVNR